MSGMKLGSEDIVRLCERVEGAQAFRHAIPRLTLEYPEMTPADAYAVQAATRHRALAAGQRLVGWKAGLTSQAKMQQMGVSAPLLGYLTDRMAQPEGTPLVAAELLHPRVECEIGFVLKRALSGPDCTAEAVIDATDFVVPALEIIDSRYVDFSFDLPSVIADNASSARFVTGSAAARPAALDLRHLGVVMEKNGEIVAMGAAAAVLGHPAAAVAMLANVLAGQGQSLAAGSLILSGGITAAIPIAAGDSISARFQSLGSVTLRVV